MSLKVKIAFLVLFGSAAILLTIPSLFNGLELPMQPLERIINFMVFIVIVTFIFGLINAFMVGRLSQKIQRRQLTQEEFLKIFISFAIPIISAFVLGMFADLMKSSARTQLSRFLSSVSDKKLIYVNDQVYEDPNRIINQLKSIQWMTGHHSHPTNKIDIRIVDSNKNMSIFLRRDSEYSGEYWVYYPCYKYTSEEEIGRINTNLFDKY